MHRWCWCGFSAKVVGNWYEVLGNFVRSSYEFPANFVQISYQIRPQSALVNVVVRNFVRISQEVRTICKNLYHFGAEHTHSAHSTQHTNTTTTQKNDTVCLCLCVRVCMSGGGGGIGRCVWVWGLRCMHTWCWCGFSAKVVGNWHEVLTNFVRSSYEFRANFVRISCELQTNFVRISYQIRPQSAPVNVVVRNFVRISQEVRTICRNLYHFGAKQTHSAHSTQHSNTTTRQKNNTVRRSYGLPAHNSTTGQNIMQAAQCKEPSVSILHTQLHVHREDKQNDAPNFLAAPRHVNCQISLCPQQTAWRILGQSASMSGWM